MLNNSLMKVRKARESDYLHWLEKDSWDPVEASILLAGYEPMEFPDGNVEFAELAGDADGIHRRIIKAINLKTIEVRNTPAAWTKWANQQPITLPKELVQLQEAQAVRAAAAAETPFDRRHRLMKWLAEEKKVEVRGALQRVYLRETVLNPKADRSNIGKQIKVAESEQKNGVSMTSMTTQLIKDGKRKK